MPYDRSKLKIVNLNIVSDPESEEASQLTCPYCRVSDPWRESGMVDHDGACHSLECVVCGWVYCHVYHEDVLEDLDQLTDLIANGGFDEAEGAQYEVAH